MKGVHIKKEEIKLSLVEDDIAVCVENLIYATKNLEPESEFNKVIGYTINTQRLLLFLCSSN